MNDKQNTCILCHSAEGTVLLIAKDYTVSNKDFEVWQCGACGMRQTTPQPSAEVLGSYYKSDTYISHSNQGKGFINKVYLIVRNITLKQKAKWLNQHSSLNKSKHLDYGAGTGYFVNTMLTNHWESTGIEPDADARMVAKKQHGFDLLTLEDLPLLKKNEYDAITLWHVLEHIQDLHSTLSLLIPSLNSTGTMFIAVPNPTSFDAMHYKHYWAGLDVPRHLWHFSPANMQQLATMYDLKLVETKPMWFDAWYVSMLSEKYKKGNIVYAMFWAMLGNIATLFAKHRCSSLVYVLKKT